MTVSLDGGMNSTEGLSVILRDVLTLAVDMTTEHIVSAIFKADILV